MAKKATVGSFNRTGEMMSKFKLVLVRKVSALILVILCLLWFGSTLFAAVTPPPEPPEPPEEPNTNYYYWNISGMWSVSVNITEWGFDPATGLLTYIGKFSSPPPRYSTESYYGVMDLNPNSLFYNRTEGYMDITSFDSDHQNIPIFTASNTVAYSPFDVIYSGMNVDLLSNIESITTNGTQIEGHFYDPNPPVGRIIVVSYTASGQANKIFHPVVLKPEDKMGGTPISYLDKVSLNQENYTATTDLPYKAKIYGNPYTGIINWKNELIWEPSPQRGSLTKLITFATAFDEEHYEDFGSMGGKLTISASANLINSNLSVPAIWTSSGLSSGYIMITGPEGNIPKAEITARVIDLYNNGATPKLMTGIAMVESTYRQFYNHLFNYSDLWMPLVSDDSGDGIWGDNNDGSHVGLMQTDIRKNHVSEKDRWQRAWNWLINTSEGVNLFQDEKIRMAKAMEKKIIIDFLGHNPDLRIEDIEELNAIGVENMALVLYGPHAAYLKIDKQYYILIRENNKGVWKENTSGNPDGINYAKKIRREIVN